ncbi:hypothetical protein T492DRAFT_917862, partial [Pavlovales sp. CCMP2436]
PPTRRARRPRRPRRARLLRASWPPRSARASGWTTARACGSSAPCSTRAAPSWGADAPSAGSTAFWATCSYSCSGAPNTPFSPLFVLPSVKPPLPLPY